MLSNPARSLVLVLATCVLASCQSTPVTAPPATKPDATVTRGTAPVLQSVEIRRDVRAGNGRVVSAVPDFHFMDAEGDVILIRREVIETNGSISTASVPPTTPIITAADFQKKGAIFSGGGWVCGTPKYYIKLAAQLQDASGNLSNKVEYTFHCNGG
jgi:hypothetical protein